MMKITLSLGLPLFIPNNGAPVEDNTDKLEVSSGYTIVPAYNKGPYMVVAKADLKEVGKRR